MRGCAARVAYDPQVVVAFLDAMTDYEMAGVPRRRRKTINGVVPDQNTDARIIRRYRSGRFGSTTEPAVARLLARFDLTTETLRMWAALNNHTALIRGDR